MIVTDNKNTSRGKYKGHLNTCQKPGDGKKTVTLWCQCSPCTCNQCYFLPKRDAGKSERKPSTELRKLLFQVLLILIISQIKGTQQLSLVFVGDMNIYMKRVKNDSAVPCACAE